jgi:hypothetical protein
MDLKLCIGHRLTHPVRKKRFVLVKHSIEQIQNHLGGFKQFL